MSFNEGGMSPADYAAITRGNDDGMFGGNGAWWLIILFLFFMNGWGGNYGGYGRGGTDAGVREAIDNQTLISKLDQQTYGLADGVYALNNTITNGFANAELSRCNQQAALTGQLNTMALADQKCCCETQAAIANTNYNIATQACDTRSTIQNTGRDITDAYNSGTLAILNKLSAMEAAAKDDKIASLTADVQALRFAASQTAQNSFITANQEAQTAELIRRLGRDCPVPAYVVPNPNCCYNPCGCGSF